jgi:hypothetical protein
MRCHLLIPALFKPAVPIHGLHVPALRTLLARASISRVTEQDMESWLCHIFGVEKQQDWPIAALSLMADGVNPGNAYWLRADPVNLQADRGQLLLMDSRAFRIAKEEADQFVHALNTHFADRGCVFYAPYPQRWYLRLDNAPKLQTSPLNQVLGKNVDDFLASGADSLYWQGICNEVQMLLHEHPFNEARETRGDLPVNSIWLWGGGSMPAHWQKPFSGIWANEHLTRSLALASVTPCHSLPGNVEKWLEQIPAQDAHLMVFDSLQSAALYRDAVRWQAGVIELETSWFAPLLAALKRGQIAQINIDADGVSFRIMPKDLWKWWRRHKPLAEYAN